MIYDIQTKSDFNKGATLVVRLPEEDIDKKAFFTIGSNTPDFLLPFSHKNVDGQVELTYLLGKNSKFLYLAGSFSAKVYAELLHNTLNPLIECEDWFLNPYSFVFNSDYIYYDNQNKIVKYLYIPSVKQISDLTALVETINTLVEHIRVTDVDLENKVLRALRKEFNPTVFLELLKPYHKAADNSHIQAGAAHQPSPASAQQNENVADKIPHIKQNVPVASTPVPVSPAPASPTPASTSPVPAPASSPRRNDDIFIDFGADPKDKGKNIPVMKEPKPAAKEKRGGLFGSKKKESATGGLFGGKGNSKPASVMMGAAAEAQVNYAPQQQQPQQHINHNQPVNIPFTDEDDGFTVIMGITPEHTGFKLISRHVNLPEKINVNMKPGMPFTIGRHSTSVGTKQSDFEFPAGTKEISRRHAAIERNQSGYCIVDIGSSAGTFVNTTKLIPNAPHALTTGDKVSFGRAGADYVWETME
jgi:hypothetical protein